MRPALLVVVALGVSGCLGSPLAPSADPSSAAGASPQVVVALIDTGIHPYHEAFRLREASAPQVPQATKVPREFQREWEIRGSAAFADLEIGTLYWFEGTRVLGIALDDGIPEDFAAFEAVFPPDPHPIYDDERHGTAVASVVAAASPHAWIVMVAPVQLSFIAFEWASHQPWIDVVSSSLGDIANTPNNLTDGPEDGFARVLQNATRDGKLVVSAVDNTPAPGYLHHSGAPWVIGVGGANPEQRGPTPITSLPVEVVADFTVEGLARNDSDDATYTAQGSSFAAPLVAGVLAEAIYQARAHSGHVGGIRDGALVATPDARLTNADFRRALNLTAALWNTTDWSPTLNTSWNPFQLAQGQGNPPLPHVPGTPVGPWVQMGWGYVDGSTAGAIAGLLLGSLEAPDKADAAAYMEAVHAAKEQVWAARQGGAG